MNRIAAYALVLLSLTTLAAAPAVAAPPPQPSLSVPVAGTGTAGALTGALNIRDFVVFQDGVAAVGVLTATITSTTGVVTTIVRNVTLPVLVGDTSCEILHLDLGPLSLDILGLQIDLSRIVLDITAQAGAGNLLGNLLCAVAGLLDNPAGLARVLDSILAILG